MELFFHTYTEGSKVSEDKVTHRKRCSLVIAKNKISNCAM